MVTASRLPGRKNVVMGLAESSYTRNNHQGARPIDGGTESCTGSTESTRSSPCVSGIWQSFGSSTLQYLYGPTRVRWPCEYALISGRRGPCSRASAHAPTPAAADATTKRITAGTAAAGLRLGIA